MTEAEIEDILRAPVNAVVGTNRIDGAPHLSPTWYLYEAGRLYISVGADSVKARNLRRDPRIGVCIDEGHPDGRAITVYGLAELIEDESPWRDEIVWRITRRYFESDEDARRYEEEEAAAYGPSAMIVVTPGKIVSHDTE